MRVACALVHPAGTAGPWQGTTESYGSAAPQARQARTAPFYYSGRSLRATRHRGPGSITGLAAGRGIGYGILDPLVLIFAVSVLLAGLLTGLVTAAREGDIGEEHGRDAQIARPSGQHRAWFRIFIGRSWNRG